jgi:protein AATF/BFR2
MDEDTSNFDDEVDDGESNDDDDDESDDDDNESGVDRAGNQQPFDADLDDGSSSDDVSDDDSDDSGTAATKSRQLSDALIASELAKLEEAEKAAVQQMRADPEADRRKGEHIRAQLATWDAVVECRIRLQPCMLLANRLPCDPELFDTLRPSVTDALAEASRGCIDVVDQLLQFQQTFAAQNPEVQQCAGAAAAVTGDEAESRRDARKRSPPADSDEAWERIETWNTA